MDNTDNKPPETPEPIFENVVDEKFPGAYDSMMAPEEVVDDAATLDDVAYNPTPTGFAPKNSDDKMQRYIFISAIVIFFVGIFFVLYSIFKPKTTTSNASTTPVKLTIWGLWEDEEQFAQIIDNYKKVKPNVTISYKKMAITDYLSLVKNRSKNGQGPDIFRFHNTWIPNLIGQGQPVLAAAPSTIFSKQEFDKTFYKVTSDDLTVGQQVYGVPLYIDSLVLLYNKKILNQIGITLVPQNLELIGSFLDVVSRATVKNAAGDVETAGVAMGTYANVEHAPDIFASLVLLNNLQNQSDLSGKWARGVFANLANGTGQDVAGDALKIYLDAVDKKYWSQAMPNSIDAFAQEKVALVYSYLWQIPVIKAKNPNLDFEAIGLPVGLPDSKTNSPKRVSLASYWAEGVSAYSPNQIEAFEFLKFASSAQSAQIRFEKQVATLGVGFPSARQDMKSVQIKDKYAKAVLSQVDNLVSVPLVAKTQDNAINDESLKYVENAINSPLQGGSYANAIDSLKNGLSQIYAKYKIDY